MRSGKAAGLLIAAACVVSGCSSTTLYTDPNPVVVTAHRPAAPPAPMPTRIEVTESIHFENASAVIRNDSLHVIDGVAQIIKDHPELGRIRVEGHTDHNGSRDFNSRLSQARAEAVVQRLIDQGVPRDRLEPVGFGFDRPVATNDSVEGRAQNRRVEFVIVDREDG